MIKSLSVVFPVAGLGLLLAGCSVDKNNEKYDELRFDQLQKANCTEMASVLSASFITDEPEDYDSALKRCEDMKSLSFDEYQKLSEHARATGSWDIYELYPEKE